jgi:ATP-dependent Clp protease adaptor protein ClpS
MQVDFSSGSPGTVGLPEGETKTSTRIDRLWNVVVWDDPINLMSYVTYIFQKIFGYSEQLATKLMIEVHTSGKSIVATVEREKAEFYVGRLHQFGLQATLEKQGG